jgi:hypothetical protein
MLRNLTGELSDEARTAAPCPYYLLLLLASC